MQEGSHINVFEEWMPGGSIAGLLDKHGPFTESVILRYLPLKGTWTLHRKCYPQVPTS